MPSAYNEDMFFFIGGVQPRTRAIDGEARACPACGRIALRHQRTDHVLSVFFVPLFLVKRGLPCYACENCGAMFDEEGRKWAAAVPQPDETCRFCGRVLDGDFAYCPYCGTPRAG